MPSPYTDQQLLDILRDLAAELGRSPTVQELLARPGLPSHSTYFNRFASWNAALEAAGLETRPWRPDYTDAQLLDVLRDLAAELGRTPTRGDLLARPDLPSPTAYTGHFGNWNAALEAAGLEPCRRAPHRRAAYTNEQLLAILRHLAAELGRPPTDRELRARRDLPPPTAYRKHFGSWNAALEAAGLETRRRRPDYGDEQLLEALRGLAAELGRPPTRREMSARRDLPSHMAYVNRFGRWSDALEAAGLEPDRRPDRGAK
jgi:hypothetical protein